MMTVGLIAALSLGFVCGFAIAAFLFIRPSRKPSKIVECVCYRQHGFYSPAVEESSHNTVGDYVSKKWN